MQEGAGTPRIVSTDACFASATNFDEDGSIADHYEMSDDSSSHAPTVRFGRETRPLGILMAKTYPKPFATDTYSQLNVSHSSKPADCDP